MTIGKTLLSGLLLLHGLLYCAASAALALADVELLSNLNQPLRAKIALPAVTQAELNSMTVSLGPSDPAALGAASLDLRHALRQDAAGHYIEITSAKPIREPVVTIRVALEWSQGRLQRDYVLLIDPAVGIAGPADEGLDDQPGAGQE